MRPRRVNQAQRLGRAAGLGQLHHQPARPVAQPRHVGREVAALVDIERQRRAAVEPGQAFEILGRQRLLDELDAQPGERRQQTQGLVARPAAVGVDPQRLARALPDPLHRPEVIGAPDLDLENGVILCLVELSGCLFPIR